MYSGIIKLMLFAAVAITLSECYNIRKRLAEKCRKLSHEERENMLKELTQDLHWSFLISPPFQQTARQIYPLSRSADSSSTSETQLGQALINSCPAKFQPGTKICPLHYVQQTDNNRIPENIIHARCTCKTCSMYRSSTRSGNCEKVKVDTLVWKRADNSCKYEKQIEQVTVACICRTS